MTNEGLALPTEEAESVVKKSAIITGILGQDGAYLAAWLLEQGYEVRGWHRPGSVNASRLERLGIQGQVELIPVNLADTQAVADEIAARPFAEFYHLASLSAVADGENRPLLLAQEDALNGLRAVDAIRHFRPEARFLQASSAEVFGMAEEVPQTENTPHRPVSSYGCCKSFSQNMVAYYREKFGLYACSAILYNHESPLRDERFVTQKIILSLLRQREGGGSPLELGNLETQRDWGSAQEYVQAMWKMLQLESPEDVLLATGVATTVRRFVEMCAAELGFELAWRIQGKEEQGYDLFTGRVLVKVSAELQRRKDHGVRVGDPSRALELLGWKAQVNVQDLISWMIQEARLEAS